MSTKLDPELTFAVKGQKRLFKHFVEDEATGGQMYRVTSFGESVTSVLVEMQRHSLQSVPLYWIGVCRPCLFQLCSGCLQQIQAHPTNLRQRSTDRLKESPFLR
ncbi:hypothetical protein GCM10027404_32990 [Arthrobacter tumbae]